MISVETLLEYVKWMEKNNHEIETYQDYGNCGFESIRCAAPGCYAGRYEWDRDHVAMYVKELTAIIPQSVLTLMMDIEI